MIPIFIDSSFWIAFRSKGDPHHELAKAIATRVASCRAALRSTALVFAEIHAFFCPLPLLREQIINEFWHRGVIELAPVTEADQREALRILSLYRDKDFSFCDATSFVVMRRLKLRRVLSFDAHFQPCGEFEVLTDPNQV